MLLVGLVLHRSGPNYSPLAAQVKGTIHTASGTLPHAYLHLATYPDSMAGEHGSDGGAHPDWVSYGPSTNLHVPAHALVTVTIRQYDSGDTITNPYFAKVHGTLGGTMTRERQDRDGDQSRRGRPHVHHPRRADEPGPVVRQRAAAAVPDDRPVVKGSDYRAPNIVTFSFVTGGKGEYAWNCEFPCGDGYYAKFGGPMSTRGYMSGTLTVG